MWYKRRKIKRLVDIGGKSYYPTKNGELIQKEGCHKGIVHNECSVRHLGGGRYLIGISKGNYPMFSQPLIDTWIILYPSMIKFVEFK